MKNYFEYLYSIQIRKDKKNRKYVEYGIAAKGWF